MSDLTKIVVAIDFSKYSEPVAEHAVNLAKKLGAELIFVNVLSQQQVSVIKQTLQKLNYDRNRISMDQYLQELIEEREADMATLVKKMKMNGISYKFDIVTGIPFRELIASVERHQADMVVMGTKGKADIKEVLVGSTALKMFRHCPVPLVSIRTKGRVSA